MWQRAIHKTTTLFQCLLVHLWQDIADVVPRVPVQALLEPLLIEEVADEADAASEHKHPIQRASLDVRLCLVLREEPTEEESALEYIFKRILATAMYLCLSKSTKHTAMQPSTLRMRFGFFLVVICSTSLA